MNQYIITISYSLGSGGSLQTLSVLRNAANPGAAIAAATAAFQAVSNVRTPDQSDPPKYTPYIKISDVTAALVI